MAGRDPIYYYFCCYGRNLLDTGTTEIYLSLSSHLEIIGPGSLLGTKREEA